VEFTAPAIGAVEPGGALWEAGFAAGDRIVAVGGRETYSYENVVVEAALAGPRPLPITVARPDGSTRQRSCLPQWNELDGRYELGFRPAIDDAAPTLLSVRPGGPASRAGIADGAVLLAVDDVPANGATLPTAMATLQAEVARTVRLRVRDAAGERDVAVASELAADGPARIGVTPLPRRVRGIRQDDANAARIGIARGDVVLAIDERAFLSGDLVAAMAGNGVLTMTVRRGREVVRLAGEFDAAARRALAEAIALATDDPQVVVPSPGAAAAAAGLLPGDRIEAVDGEPIGAFDELRAAIEAAAGRSAQLRVRRAAVAVAVDPASADHARPSTHELAVTPVRQPAHDLGVAPSLSNRTTIVRCDTIGGALVRGMAMSIDLVKQIYLTLKRMATGDVGAKNMGGIIRISQVSYRAAERGTAWLLYMLAMLSLNLAIVNLLPVPMLDGGHLLFLLIERIKGSPVSARVFGYSQMAGLVFVLFLILFVTYNDILQLL
jgi:regulator of sigma E protease